MSQETRAENPTLKADYVASGTTKKLRYTLEALTEQPTPKQTTTYISSLRKSVLQLQVDLNIFLTQKMEEDKAAASANGNGSATNIDEQKEEENYGEEVEED